jgi:hypothetical protein
MTQDQASRETFLALQAAARAAGKDLNAAAGRFGVERLLHRVFASPHAGRFAVKGGALMLIAEGLGPLRGRATSDADLALPSYGGGMEGFEAMMREALSAPHPDGVTFDLDTWQVRAEREAGGVGGGSISVRARIGRHLVGVKVDVTFDGRTPASALERVDYPCVLGGSFPVSNVPASHAAADKIQAMVRHGARNHRLRDHYDLFVLLTQGGADPAGVAEALPASLACFGLAMPADADAIPALAHEEALRRLRPWEAERRSRGFGVPTPPFPELNAILRGRVGEILALAHESAPSPGPF